MKKTIAFSAFLLIAMPAVAAPIVVYTNNADGSVTKVTTVTTTYTSAQIAAIDANQQASITNLQTIDAKLHAAAQQSAATIAASQEQNQIAPAGAR